MKFVHVIPRSIGKVVPPCFFTQSGWMGHIASSWHICFLRCVYLLFLLQESKDKDQGKEVFVMMIVFQQNKKRREPGNKCHARTMMHIKPINLSK